MNRNSILLVSSAFYPENSPRSFRATELAKEFHRQGHHVVVLSKYREHDYTEFLKEYPIIFKMWRKPLFQNVPTLKLKPFSLLTRAISRLLSVFFEYPDIEQMIYVKKMLKIEREYDLMVSFAVPFPVHWGVASARSEKHPIAKTWIADCGDPYMFARLDTFRKPFYFKYLEINFCKVCDYISVPFKEMQNQFYPRFISKIRVIPQGFNFDEIRLSEGPQNNSLPVFVFAGSLIPGKRDLSLLLDFLASLDMDFRFVVYTNQIDWFRRYKGTLGERLVLNEYIGRLALLYEMSSADFLINIDTSFDSDLNIEAVPSKLIDYALSKRPILNLNSSNLDKEIVLEFLNKNYVRQRDINIENYDIRKVAKQFIELAS